MSAHFASQWEILRSMMVLLTLVLSLTIIYQVKPTDRLFFQWERARMQSEEQPPIGIPPDELPPGQLTQERKSSRRSPPIRIGAGAARVHLALRARRGWARRTPAH